MSDSTAIAEPADQAAPIGAGFDTLGLDPRLLKELTTLGYEEATPVQRETIPLMIAGRDLIAMAATGTGKTAAFALPILQRLIVERGAKAPRPSALVLVPTRELAMQVAQAIHRYGRPVHVEVLPIYGGQAYGPQLRALERGVDVVVATPGRAIDHLNRGTMKLDSIKVVVLDEADEMLDMGFAEDIETILSATPKERQTVLFSATMPAKINGIAKRHLNDPVQVKIAREKVEPGTMPKIDQRAYIVPRLHKVAALGRVLDTENPTSAIVFCRRRNDVDELAEMLNARGYKAEGLHGGMTQDQRDRVMKRFRAGGTDLLVATDVAARGLDIDHLSHVVNYDMPSEPEDYVHRIGRVGRAGRAGVAITLAEPREHRCLQNIEKLTKRKIELAQVPTVADLRAKRLDVTRATVREAILEGGLDQFRTVVESLATEFDIMQIALAAVKLGHKPDDGEEMDIPPPETFDRPVRLPGRDRGDRPGRPGRPDRPGARGPAPSRGRAGRSAGMTRLFVGAGRQAGIRPQDLVGAIANESGVPGNMIGAIEISDRFSLVDVPEDAAATVIAALRGTTIKGRKVLVRRDSASD